MSQPQESGHHRNTQCESLRSSGGPSTAAHLKCSCDAHQQYNQTCPYLESKKHWPYQRSENIFKIATPEPPTAWQMRQHSSFSSPSLQISITPWQVLDVVGIVLNVASEHLATWIQRTNQSLRQQALLLIAFRNVQAGGKVELQGVSIKSSRNCQSVLDPFPGNWRRCVLIVPIWTKKKLPSR